MTSTFEFDERIITKTLFTARAEEEAVVTPTKLTNQLYVRSAATSNTNSNNSNAMNGGDESMNSATFVSVVSRYDGSYLS